MSFIMLCVTSFGLCAEEEKPSSVNTEDGLLTIDVSVDRNKIAIGDVIKYVITVKTTNDIEVELPGFGEHLAEFAVKDFGSDESVFFGNKTVKQWFELDTYFTGTYEIPSALIRYKTVDADDSMWEEVESASISVEIESVLTQVSEDQDIYDIKGPVAFSRKKNMIIIASICVGIFLVVVAIMVLKRRRRVYEKVIPARPAHEIAYEALDGLQTKDYPSHNMIKDYYFELSLIVRHYLENRFRIKAPEMTTEEFLTSVKDAKILVYEHKNILKDFMIECDMVKFAKYGPEPNEISSSFQTAVRLVDQTKEAHEKAKKDVSDDGL